MFDDDAEDTRARAEAGKKNERFRELFQSIKMEIGNDADSNILITRYRIRELDIEFVEPLIEWLEREDRAVTFDEDANRLIIDSSETPEAD